MDTAGRELFVFCILMVDGPVGIRRVVPQCPWPRRGAAITYTRTERAFVSSAPSAKDSAHVIISLRLCVASHPARLCMRPFCLRRSPSLGTPPHESTSTGLGWSPKVCLRRSIKGTNNAHPRKQITIELSWRAERSFLPECRSLLLLDSNDIAARVHISSRCGALPHASRRASSALSLSLCKAP